jgi:sugar lactone lactonase YvrE
MNRTYIIITTVFSLVLTGIVIATLDKASIIYAQEQDNNIMEIESSDTTNASKANATETAAASDTKANATETAAASDTKANATETAAASDTKAKASETPYAATIAKLQPGGEVKYCYSYSYQFGSKGSDEGEFDRPHDIVFDSKGFLYINDRELNTFQKFTPDGKYISQFGEKGSKLGEYLSPYSMAIDSNDIIYVLDRGNDRIVKVDTEGKVLGALYSYDGQWITNNDQIKDADKKSKNTNGESTQFASPEAMAIDKEGNYYVTDTGNNRIIKFDKNFKYISHFGEFGSGPGQFDHPHGIGIDSDGNIYINGLNTPKIQKFTNDGKFIKEWGSEGTGPGQFTLLLEHLKVDPADRIFITDGAGNPRVQVFDTEGKFLTQFGEMGSGDGQLKKPEHVAFDAKDKKATVYVVDRGNQRTQAFLPCQE